MQERPFFFLLSIHICWGGKRGSVVGEELVGRPLMGFSPHDAAALSACVNKASLNCLIILCKLRDQGTYRKLASKHSAECVSLAHVFKSFSSTSSCSYSKLNEPWYILMMSKIKSAFCLNSAFLNDRFQLSPTKKNVTLFITCAPHISLSHKLTINDCFCSAQFLQLSILHTLLIKHVLELLSGTTHILISITQHPEYFFSIL